MEQDGGRRQSPLAATHHIVTAFIVRRCTDGAYYNATERKVYGTFGPAVSGSGDDDHDSVRLASEAAVKGAPVRPAAG